MGVTRCSNLVVAISSSTRAPILHTRNSEYAEACFLVGVPFVDLGVNTSFRWRSFAHVSAPSRYTRRRDGDTQVALDDQGGEAHDDARKGDYLMVSCRRPKAAFWYVKYY